MQHLSKRFWAKVRSAENGCQEWQGCVTRNGYGQCGVDGQVLYAHRVAWQLTHAEDPGCAYVLHTCDNRRCVNPEHLYLGTFYDNMADMVAKGRQARGERNGHAKLTEADVLAIRASDETGRALAQRYGVAPSTLSLARSGKQWKHI